MKKIQPKFKVGDKVRLVYRTPAEVRQGLQARTRTVVKVAYNPEHQCCYYQLGSRGKGELGYWFRSYMLKRVKRTERHQIGKPRVKRCYRRKDTRSRDTPLDFNRGGLIVVTATE